MENTQSNTLKNYHRSPQRIHTRAFPFHYIYLWHIPSISQLFMLMKMLTTILYLSVSSNNSFQINNDLSKIHMWLKLNKLSLNINKTKFRIFHKPHKQIDIPSLQIDKLNIEYVEHWFSINTSVGIPPLIKLQKRQPRPWNFKKTQTHFALKYLSNNITHLFYYK